jgi:hypothetical protein
MVKIWSHWLKPGRVAWKMSWRPSAEKYASAFSPPLVSMRTLASRGSSGLAGYGRAPC